MKALFIVGHWNSGTTLLVDVLMRHPQLKLKRARYKPNLEDRTIRKILWKMNTDFPEFGEYENVNANGFVNYPEPSFSTDQMTEFRKRFEKKYGKNEKKTLLLKNPWLLFLSQIMTQSFVNDDVKYVFIIRDGRSQVTSKDYWLRSSTPEQHLINRATFWTRCMEYYFEHWHGNPNLLTLRYENLCTHPKESIESICQHRQLDLAPIESHLPAAFENRMSKWNNLKPELQSQVSERIQNMQQRIDSLFPVIGS